MKDDQQRDPHDGDYIGNVFGWRISLLGGIVLLLFLGLIVYRHYSMGVPPGLEMEADDPLKTEADTLDKTAG